MFSLLSSHVLIALALVPSAFAIVPINNSPVTLPLARRHALGGKNILAGDQARVQQLKTAHLSGVQNSKRDGTGVGITNTAIAYTVDVTVGNPPQPFTLIVDTGSANTWVGADDSKHFVANSNTKKTNALIEVTYGSGLFGGDAMVDTFSVGGLTIPQQQFASARFSEGFSGYDGILGLGPVGLTNGTSTSRGSTIPTVVDNAFANGLISSKAVGFSFTPSAVEDVANGHLTFGGADSSLYTGQLTFVPITKTSPSSKYVGIDQTITYDGQTLLTSSGIVDSGTTLLLIATDALAKYTAATGATTDLATGLLTLTPAQFANLKSLFFTIGGTKFELTPNAQIWPRALNTAIGGDPDTIYLIVADVGSPTGSGLDFVNGLTFLERFYSVYDAGKSQFGLAPTAHTFDTTN